MCITLGLAIQPHLATGPLTYISIDIQAANGSTTHLVYQ
jgi:hypothetical protein